MVLCCVVLQTRTVFKTSTCVVWCCVRLSCVGVCGRVALVVCAVVLCLLCVLVLLCVLCLVCRVCAVFVVWCCVVCVVVCVVWCRVHSSPTGSNVPAH